MNIEQDLHQALARKPAPPDLAERVIARLDRDESGAALQTPLQRTSPDAARTGAGGAHRYTRWLAAAAAVILIGSGAARYYEHQQEAAEAARVKEEIRVALQITSDKLSRAQARIQASGHER
jgi:hypothetical protein